MKTVAVLLVLGVAGYAIYDLFKGNRGAALFGPRGTTVGGVSVPGVPVYRNVSSPSNWQGTVISAATAATAIAAAFGPDENQLHDDEIGTDEISSQFAAIGY